MKKSFLVAGIVTTVTNLLLNAVAYAVIVKDFYQSHPAVSNQFMKQLQRQPDQLIGWAMGVTSVAMDFFTTLIIKWSGATTFTSGLKYGSIVALLFWGSVNFGLYASSNFFSQESVFVDYVYGIRVLVGALSSSLIL